MSKFKPGDKVRHLSCPNNESRVVVGDHPAFPNGVVYAIGDSYLAWDNERKLELVPDPREEAIEAAARVVADYYGFRSSPKSASGVAQELADAGLLKY